ncbi:295_t:CDS:2 [Diversispora eburnea]|uniref:295_t:CDS:1 n=1 Tax=Diversispora eburnea TaxID=1213867 RepID=A0A9N9B9R8_9GLOM|nr:295_t:CDS:2 [Diversispora eburnea]
MKKSSLRDYAQSLHNRVSSDDEESRIETYGEFIVSPEDDSGEVRGSTRDTRRLAMELDRQALEAENLDSEELALKMIQRYGRRRDQISQIKSTIPTQFTAGVNQPNLFVVRYALKGCVYVEAWKLAHLQKAVQNMNNLFNSAIKLVPLEERSQVLTRKRKEKGPKEGSWARVRKGKYAGDIVQIAWIWDANPTMDEIKEFLLAADSHTRNFDGPATLPTKAVFFPDSNDRGI